MTTTEPTSTPDAPQRSATAMAALVTLVLAAGLIGIVVLTSFSAHNAPASVHGTTATTSHWLNGDGSDAGQ